MFIYCIPIDVESQKNDLLKLITGFNFALYSVKRFRLTVAYIKTKHYLNNHKSTINYVTRINVVRRLSSFNLLAPTYVQQLRTPPINKQIYSF
jgi:hypothetical protein